MTVAKGLLGKKIVRKVGNQRISGIITETEAYRHKDDPASHAYRKITERNKVMFGDVGFAYVYFTYGMHFCFNVVAKNSKTAAGAVLIRAIKPEKGIEIMQENRGDVNLKNLTNGPAKLAQAGWFLIIAASGVSNGISANFTFSYSPSNSSIIPYTGTHIGPILPQQTITFSFSLIIFSKSAAVSM